MEQTVIVAMKGQPCSGKSTLAREIAKGNKWTLIDQDDLRTSSTLDEFSYFRIASTQLQLGISVIIDSPFTHQSHLDQLLQLSTNTGARLLIVECRPKDQFEWRKRFVGRNKLLEWEAIQKQPEPDDNIADGNNQISKLMVNTTRYVKYSDLCRAINHLATLGDDVCEDFDNWKGDTSKPNEETNNTTVHVHELSLSDEQKSSSSTTHCGACLEPISAGQKYYICSGCNNLNVHKLCAELPNKIELEPRGYPPFLQSLPTEYSFPKKLGFSLCQTHDNEDLFQCAECLFRTNLRRGFLASIVKHKSHEHPLSLAMYPRSHNFEFKCRGCGDLGKHILYKCSDSGCSYDCHTNCVALPYTINCKYHRHPLTFSPDPNKQGYSDGFICYICDGGRNENRWSYRCGECSHGFHLKCAFSYD